ncbi:MAG: phosphoribosylanthranilate isomerase [Gammaproteobacteria bacterium]|nr:phosphoribosylanthranilate isomerase [Gammaproteobacteria bacterium]MBQ0774029.1 phosphoribosylanthranilate isomerase [Gammaproteobacteria bacterium]
MHRTRVKICGITRAEDMRVAVAAGADALGFVFYPPSPRAVTVEQAREIVAQTPAFVTTVGLFVNPTRTEVEAVLASVSLDMLQFHGDESAEFCQSFGRPFIKAVRMKEGLDLRSVRDEFSAARGLLVDTYVSGVPGGTGERFDWCVLPSSMRHELILAGGLTPHNIASAVEQVRPWAVDVSGGVEDLDDAGKPRGGIKSAQAIQDFIVGVNSVRPS